MGKELRILILEDQRADAELVTRELRKAGFDFVAKTVTTEKEYLAELWASAPDLILADYSLLGYDGLSALAAAQKQCPQTPFVFVSGSPGEEKAIETLHLGATDYVLKQRLTRLGPAVRRALLEQKEKRRNQQAEQQVRELNLVLRATGAISSLMVRERDPKRLLSEACKILVETRGYQLAWIGLVEPGSKRVVPAACAGKEGNFLDSASITWDETPTGQGPIGIALRTRQPVAIQDTSADPRFARWKEAAKARGLAAMAAMPMVHDSRVLGVVAVYSDRARMFDAEELDLLKELASDLALACQSIEHEQERMRAEARLHLLREALESAANAIVITDLDGDIIWANSAFTNLTGYPLEEALGRKPSLLKSGQHDGAFYQNLWETVLAGRVWSAEMINRRKDGSLYTEENTITPVRNEQGEITHFISVKQDITERKRAELRIAAFANLGQRLNAVNTSREAAEIIVQLADELLGWDACLFDLYYATENRLSHLLSMDLIDGRRAECKPLDPHGPPTELGRRAIEKGGQLILRDHPDALRPEEVPFGDTSRPSASILFVPIRHGTEVLGVLSIQSYTPAAYDASSLEALQALADYGGGALERLRAQEAFSESEANFRSVWERSIDGMRLTDKEGRILAVNEAFCQLVRLPREKLEGQMFPVAYKGQGPNDDIEVYQKRFAIGDIAPRDLPRAQLWNADEVDLEISNSFVELGQRGKMLLSIFRDVSERKRAELRIEAFSNLGKRLSAAKTAREAAGIISEVADELLGWDTCLFSLLSPDKDLLDRVLEVDTIEGRRVENSPGFEPPSAIARHAIETGGQLILKESPNQMLPGSQPFGDLARPSASIMFVPVRKGGEVIGVMSIQSYASRAYDPRSLQTLQALADHCGGAFDRLRLEEALQRERHTAQHYLDIAEVMIVAIDPSQRVLLANRKTCEILACEESDLVGNNWFDVAHPKEGRESLKAGFSDLMAGKIAPWKYVEGLVLTRRGEKRLIAWHNTVLRDEKGRIIATLSSGEDITERKALEERLRQSQKMEAVGQLAGGVAHDFNNMLAVIQGNAELLLMHETQLTARTREGLKHVVEASQRAANLTRQLLAFSRKQELQPQPLLLNEVIANLTKMLNRVISENINLQCHYAAALPYVQADTGMIEQVILNLVVNARDAMPRGGQLRVATEQIRLDEAHARTHPEARAGEFVCLLVSDTGTGIPPEVLPRVFEPFFTTKEVGKGTGLGLATVYGVVQQHQGWIEVSTQVGKGSTFKIILPAIPTPAQPAAASAASAGVPGGTETILLVEDERWVRMATRRVLESKGYKIREAADAQEALAVWQSQAGEIALLLTDIIMPEEMTGRDLAAQLWRQRPGLRVIFMSGYSAEVIGKNAEFIQRTKSHFLQKPCSSRILLETVRRCLDEKVPGAATGKAGHAK